jgi:site-specific recombinase XerD
VGNHHFSLNGVDVYQIMKSLGHEQLSTTEILFGEIFEKERLVIHVLESIYIIE